jgi:ABC-2 type transport system ATP-binding protein
MLNTLIGFLEPEQGDILYYAEKDKQYKSIYTHHSEVRKMFGFATQAASFYPRLTVEENLLHFGALYNLPKQINQNNAKHLMELTGLLNAKDILAKDLSGGMEKKLSVACSLIHKPKILILDEPTADLDPLSREETWKMVKDIHKMGTTVIVASHFLNELEAVCTRMGILYDQKIIAVGTPDQLKGKYFKNEEISLTTHPGNYKEIAKELNKYSSLGVKSAKIEEHSLVIYTPNAERALTKLLTILRKMGEKLIHVNVTKPSLAEIFESLRKK